MKIFLSTKLTGLYQTASLISIGLTADNDKEFYAEIKDYNNRYVSIWTKNNIIANLTGKNVIKHKDLKDKLTNWLSQFKKIEIWIDGTPYDWVLFCNIWGGARYLPENIYRTPLDVFTLLETRGIDPNINREEFAGKAQYDYARKNNAIHDARVIKACYKKLSE